MTQSQQETWWRARVALRQRLESLQRAGVAQLPKPPGISPSWTPPALPMRPADESPKPPKIALPDAPAKHELPASTDLPTGPKVPPPAERIPSSPRTGSAVQPVAAAPAVPRAAEPYPEVAASCRVTALDAIRREVVHCTRCPQLATTRKQTVFGAGNPQARLCFLGEAPGADEDRQGEPFVGAAGQLLNKIIDAMKLKREDVYILNVLKCRPPQNRTPLPEETANCRSFLERQLDVIQPEFLCCLGATAAQALLRTTQSLGRLRGRFHDCRGVRVVVTYHPAYLLRYPDMKRETWEDMKLLMREMGLAVPGMGGGDK